MITLSITLGSETLAGFTFSVFQTRADNVFATISAKDLNNQVANIRFRNRAEQKNIVGNLTQDLTTGLTLSVILQADSPTDVDAYNGLAVSLRDTIVELIT